MTKPHIVILGAGPAGLGAAFKLTQTGFFDVTVLEQNAHVGGNAGSFELAGHPVDYGSHRLHPACDTEVLQDIRLLLKGDLLDRPRHGRILMKGRWIHFPLKPVDLALKLPPAFMIGVSGDALRKTGDSLLGRQDGSGLEESFASVMDRGLGSTICRDFYFPYARKIWGLEPDALSAIQAYRRVSAGSIIKMVKKALASVPGLKPPGSGRFYYPRRGFGQISECFSHAAVEHGARLWLNTRVQSVESRGVNGWAVRFERDRQPGELKADHVWSTIPVTLLARLICPEAPIEILESGSQIETRAMILIYVVLETEYFSEYDAHYFPDSKIPITRLSEPKNYRASTQPPGKTVLCAELPCNSDDPTWSQSDSDLVQVLVESLKVAGIPIQAKILESTVRRLRHAYPIYRKGYEKHFRPLDDWIAGLDRLLTFGRQGLFAHDNTHHALFMAYCAVKCLDEAGRFDQSRWQEYRRIFETHVVED